MQLLRVNEQINVPAQLAGNAVLPVALWLVIDWDLRRKRGQKTIQVGGCHATGGAILI